MPPVYESAGDFHLAKGSPGIDMGQDDPEVTVDIDGDPRPTLGTASDMGADEFVP
jgi:hypothetical protein